MTKLIGYSSYNPANCDWGGMFVPVLEEIDHRMQVDADAAGRPNPFGRIQNIQVMTQRLHIDFREFVCWVVNIEHAESLARAGWLACIGRNRIDEFVLELRKRAYEKRAWRWR